MIKPLGDRIVVQVSNPGEKTFGSIVLLDSSKEKSQEGTVVAVGEGKVLDNGARVPVDVRVDDYILFAKHSGTEIKIEDNHYLILRENDILAIKTK